MNHERKIPGEWSLARWLLLGISGIALAVAIALAAGNLADQPVGITVVEYLTNLDRIGVPRCQFVALPLPVEGADGSPVRAVALVD